MITVIIGPYEDLEDIVVKDDQGEYIAIEDVNVIIKRKGHETEVLKGPFKE